MDITLQDIVSHAAVLGLIISLIALLHEIRKGRRERDFSVFLRLIDYYQTLLTNRRENWSKIKKTITADSNLKHEISDKSSSYDYLAIRVNQSEPLYAIEHGLIEYELRCLSLLNELCRYGTEDEQKALLLKILYSSEIAWYQNKSKSLKQFMDSQKTSRLFTKFRNKYLLSFKVSDFFDELQEQT